MKILILKTFPLSLKSWDEVGILNRELGIYKKLYNNYNINYSLITFGDHLDRNYESVAYPIKIYPFYEKIKKPKNIIFSYLLSLIVPFYYKELIKSVDYIQTNQFWGSWIVLIAKLFFKKKYILREGFEYYFFAKKAKKNIFVLIIIKILSKLIYSNANKIIVTTNQIKEFIIKEFKVNQNKIEVIPNFIDTNLFRKIDNIYKMNKILCVGRLSEQKNYELLIKAVANLNVEIDIIGHGSTIKYLELSRKHNVIINFLNNIPNESLPKIYNSYKIFVICSLYEGNPKSLLEAMACENIVICTNVEGIKENYNGRNFIMINLSVKELRTAILNSLKNKKINEKIGMEARKYVANNFSIDSIVLKYYSVYKDLI